MTTQKLEKELAFYCLAAVAAALGDIAIFSLLVHFGVYFFICQAISRIIGGLISFMINKYFSFEKQKRRTLIETRRFSILYLVSYLISFLFLWFFSQIIELPVIYSKLISDGLCFIFNFISMKFYVYANVANPILTRILLYKENKSL